MPLQRRLPKVGFTSQQKPLVAEVRLGELNKIAYEAISLAALKQAGLVARQVKRARVIDSGLLSAPITVVGLRVTKGAREKILAAGGKVEA